MDKQKSKEAKNQRKKLKVIRKTHINKNEEKERILL